MTARVWIVALMLLALIGWWTSPHSPLGSRVVTPAHAAGSPVCRPPSAGAALDQPLQSPVPAGVGPFRLQPATLTPLAGINIEARVLSRRDYSSGREADISPTDLALGWGPMRDDAVVDALEISQSGRWYFYRWQNAPPLAVERIVRSSANMHFIPADDIAARELGRIREGDRVRVDGWLVEAVAPDGWRWRSSLTREDSGDGACELIYVCSIRRL